MSASEDAAVRRNVLRSIAGVIFDLNGVLVEDEPLHEAAFAAALAPYGVTLTPALYRATILGQTDAQGAARVAAVTGVRLPIAHIVQAKERLYRERLSADGRRYVAPGARALVMALAGRGLARALASASPAVEVNTWLNILDMTRQPFFFDPILTSESVYGPKPSPNVYEAIRQAWDIPAAACAVIDDHPANITIAASLGMRAIAIASTLPSSAFTGAFVTFSSLAELSALLA
ncbi:MAG TPA: HAD family phosphatase [Ktedonobacterales bacterium]